MDFHGELTTGNLHLVESVSTQGLANVLGLKKIDDIVSTPFKELKAKQQARHHSAYAVPATRLTLPRNPGAHAAPIETQFDE